jgi:signal peptidase
VTGPNRAVGIGRLDGVRDRLGALKTAATVVCVGVAVLFVVIAAPQVVGAEASYVVLTDSMEPTFSSGDVVVIDDVDPASVERGDVITYRDPRVGADGPDRTVTHRVVGVDRTDDGPVFETKGDANGAKDPYRVRADEVLGQYWFHVPHAGHVMVFARTTAGIVVFFFIPAIALLAWAIGTLHAELRSSEG